MDRRYQLDNLRRSLAMLSPGQDALKREEALALLTELVEVQRRLDALRTELRALADRS